MKILLLGSQHGNELLGDKLYAFIQHHAAHLLPHVTFRIGNPKAHARGERYIESDMNRSYDNQLDTYEARRAKSIVEDIQTQQYELVLDLHTTACKQPPCIIVEALHSEAVPFLRATSIDKIVLMRHAMVKKSLIGVCPQAISIEIANDQVDEMLQSICDDITRCTNAESHAIDRYQYAVDELLLKTSITPSEAKQLQNFVLSPAGFVPILVGENSYKKNTEYLGFKASKETVITL